MDRRLKRVFVIVLDSMGMGAMADAARFGDEGADTLGRCKEYFDRRGIHYRKSDKGPHDGNL